MSVGVVAADGVAADGAAGAGVAPAEAAAAGATEVRSAPGILFDLTRSILDDEAKISQFQEMQRRAAELRAALETTLRY